MDELSCRQEYSYNGALPHISAGGLPCRTVQGAEYGAELLCHAGRA